MSQFYGIILSGGLGSRFNSEEPKQFLKINKKTILSYCLEVFSSWKFFKSIVVVSHPDYVEKTEQIAANYLNEKDRIVIGGENRHLSTLNAIHSLPLGNNDIVVIHDAARPFVTYTDLDLVCHAAIKYYSASTSFRITDTLVDTRHFMTTAIVPRDNKFSIKTPQAFHTSILPNLMNIQYEEPPTDLCSWAYKAGVPTYMVDSNPYNVKITYSSDLKIAEAYLPLFMEAQKG